MTAQIADPIAAKATAAGGAGGSTGQPGRALRRRIGARQTLANGLT